MSKKDDWIGEHFPEDDILVMEEFDDCLVGVCYRFGQPPIAVYDYNKLIAQLAEEMGEEDAEDHFAYNIIGGWAGEYTPAFVEFLE